MGRVIVLVTAVLLMVALSLDLVTGRWVTAPWLHLLLAVVAVGLWLPAAWRVRYLQWGPLYVLGLLIYTVLRSFAGSTAIAPKMTYVIDLEQTIFLGHVPGVWLQENFFRPAHLNWLDWLAVQVHWSYFFVPHVAGLLVFLFRRELFPRYVVLVLGTFYLGLVLYYLFPTVPPWLAADYGALPGLSRIMDYAGNQVDPQTYSRLYDALGVPNPVAAMPSLHMGVTFAVYLFSRDVNRKLSWVLLGYSLLMGFSLVYIGEHYAVDVLVGMACAFFVYRVYHLWARRVAARAAERSNQQ
jgi:membrane-associated phospholipid phosphatase